MASTFKQQLHKLSCNGISSTNNEPNLLIHGPPRSCLLRHWLNSTPKKSLNWHVHKKVEIPLKNRSRILLKWNKRKLRCHFPPKKAIVLRIHITRHQITTFFRVIPIYNWMTSPTHYGKSSFLHCQHSIERNSMRSTTPPSAAKSDFRLAGEIKSYMYIWLQHTKRQKHQLCQKPRS